MLQLVEQRETIQSSNTLILLIVLLIENHKINLMLPLLLCLAV
jgi:hypothetical protein